MISFNSANLLGSCVSGFLDADIYCLFIFERLAYELHLAISSCLSNGLDIKSFTPIWHKNQEMLVRDQVNAGFKIMVVSVSAQGFDKTWLGKILDLSCIEKLSKLKEKYSINVGGEGGEMETLVIDGPIFKKKLVIDKTFKEWKRDIGTLKVKKAHLE